MSIVALCALASCTKANPAACCDTADQCTEFGITGGTRPCGTGEVCDTTGTCVASECDTSADCTSPDTPICIDHFCVAKCMVDDDCMGVSGKPVCESDGTCGECKDDTQCTDASKPTCDMTSHECRGCENDDECTSGVCIEAQGTCADQSNVVFLSQTNGSDTGTCTMAAPCATFAFALGKAVGSRNIIKILGGQFDFGATPLSLSNVSVIIDGNKTKLTANTGPVVTVKNGAVVTLEGFTFTTQPSISLEAASSAIAFGCTLSGVEVSGGTMQVVQSDVTKDLSCNAPGTLIVTADHLVQSSVESGGCALQVSRTHFDGAGDNVIGVTNGLVQIENNLITGTSELSNAVGIDTVSVGSYFRFNTLVNTSGVVGSAQPLECDASLEVDSNIFAWNTTKAPLCLTTYSLFDKSVMQTGTGNQSADSATFFVNTGAGDFHLSPTSPARGAGDPSNTTTTIDFDGAPRPNPVGSVPDTGCYEAP